MAPLQSIYEKLTLTRKAMGRCDPDQPIDFPHLMAVDVALSIIEDAAKLSLEVIAAYETAKSNAPTGHLWPDSNDVLHAKMLLDRIRIGGGVPRDGPVEGK